MMIEKENDSPRLNPDPVLMYLAPIPGVIEKLRNAPEGLDDYTEYLESILEGADNTEDQTALFREAFLFFESHSGADLGMPGPLVHFIEQAYPAYLNALCVSVERKPTTHTLWMMNRILNAQLEETVRSQLLDLMQRSANHPQANAEVQDQATGFLKHQAE